MSKDYTDVMRPEDLAAIGAAIGTARDAGGAMEKYANYFGQSMLNNLANLSGNSAINVPSWGSTPVSGTANASHMATVGTANPDKHENTASLAEELAPTAARGEMPQRTAEIG